MLQYAITDGTATLPARKDIFDSTQQTLTQQTLNLINLCAQLAQQGIAFLLIREPHLSPAALTALTRLILRAVHAAAPDAPTHILLAGRADIALAAGAHGVHLSAAPGQLTPPQVRAVLPGALVSVSCHTLDEVRRARDQQASLVLFAPVFGKSIAGSEVVPAAGLDALHAACQVAKPMPVYALGGITPANAPHCLAAGAAGIAGIRMFFAAPLRKGS